MNVTVILISEMLIPGDLLPTGMQFSWDNN